MPRRSGFPSGRRAAPALLALALLATACPARTPDQPDASASPTSAPRTGGEVVVAYPDEPATLDPFARAGEAPATRDLVRLIMPALYRLGPGGARAPWLLAEEPVVEEGPPFSVTLALREDAVWSDGEPITAEDLRYTWRTVMDARREVATRDGYDRIRRIRVLGPKRARIEFRSPFARWPDLFSAGLGVLPSHALAARGAQARLGDRWPVSGGPFVLRRWRRGLDLTFVRNPRAWGGDDPAIDRLRVVFVPDPLGALQLLRRGEVDVLGPYLAPDWQRRAGELPGARISAETGPTWMGLLLNVRASPFDDRRVRAALADALDRARLTRGLFGTEGSLLQNAEPAGRDPRRGPFARYGDLSRAERSLAAAGWRGTPRARGDDLLNPTLAYAAEDLTGVIARAVQFQAARAGFDLQTVPLDASRLWDGWLDGGRFEAAIVVWREQPGGSSRARFGTTGSGEARVRNRARLTDAALDRALVAADRDPSDGAAEQRLAALVPVIPLAVVAVSLVAGERVSGVCASGAADGPLWNAHTWRLEQAAGVAEECPTSLAA